MPIKQWPPNERPREKLCHLGAASLSDAELVAIFLRTGIRGKTAVDLARELLASYGGLRGLLQADYRHFCRTPGLGMAKYALLQAVLEMNRRHLGESLQRGNLLANPEETRRFLTAQLRERPHEVFAGLFLDNRHRLLCFEELSRGTIDGATVYAREVVKMALKHNAAAVIFAHNHPSGIAEPSGADRALTQRLKAALGLVDIRVLDHVIVGDGESVSFAERGWL